MVRIIEITLSPNSNLTKNITTIKRKWVFRLMSNTTNYL